MDNWNNFLEANRQQIKELGDISPALLLKENIQPTVIVLEEFKNGDSIVPAIYRIVKEANPNSYIFSCLGWATEFTDKVSGENPKYERIADMPLDDREKVYVQIEVLKPGLIGRSYMARVNQNVGNIFTDENNDSITESKFILKW